MQLKNKIGITPLVAILGLILITSLIGILVKNWVVDYSTQIMSNEDLKNIDLNEYIKFIMISNNVLYMSNQFNYNITLKEIDIGNNCNINSDFVLSSYNITQIDLTGFCFLNSSDYPMQKIIIITDKGIFQDFIEIR